MTTAAIEQHFQAAIAGAGLTPPDVVHADGLLHRYSPTGKRSNTSAWYVLHGDGIPAGVFGCWKVGLTSTWCTKADSDMTVAERSAHRERIRAMQAQRKEQQRVQWAKNAERNARLWSSAMPAGNQVRAYLVSRGLSGWNVPSLVREHPGLSYWGADDDGVLQELGRYPAMLAPIVKDGRLVAIHRTYLLDGQKAPVPTPKKLTAASGTLSGACIPLAAPRGGVLGIAEGIETAVAASLGSGVPVVAAYCANALAAFDFPASIDHLTVFADNDPAGQQAAAALAQRAVQAGLTSKILTPSTPGSDWADVWHKGQP